MHHGQYGQFGEIEAVLYNSRIRLAGQVMDQLMLQEGQVEYADYVREMRQFGDDNDLYKEILGMIGYDVVVREAGFKIIPSDALLESLSEVA